MSKPPWRLCSVHSLHIGIGIIPLPVDSIFVSITPTLWSPSALLLPLEARTQSFWTNMWLWSIYIDINAQGYSSWSSCFSKELGWQIWWINVWMHKFQVCAYKLKISGLISSHKGEQGSETKLNQHAEQAITRHFCVRCFDPWYDNF